MRLKPVNLALSLLAAVRQAYRHLTEIVGKVRRLGALCDAESISFDRILVALVALSPTDFSLWKQAVAVFERLGSRTMPCRQ
jgi:hypothetical protein